MQGKLRLSVAAAAGWVGLVAATPSALPQNANGIVVGHVFCADTNSPARTAHVFLKATNDLLAPHNTPPISPDGGTLEMSTVNSVQTLLDGSFTIRDVKPGAYFVIAENPGYFSPLSVFSVDELSHPTPSVVKRIRESLTRVSVEPGRATSVTLSIERGAAISGTIDFDDGSPAAGFRVIALRKWSDGSWTTAKTSTSGILEGDVKTNDLGEYRIAGLPPGEYVIKVEVALSDVAITTTNNLLNSSAEESRYSLSFFSGGFSSLHAQSAFALAAGESRDRTNLTIPLMKLHVIAGMVVAARDGHSVNAARVTLTDNDAQKDIASTTLDQKDGQYRFDFVPEGNYTIRVEDAEDIATSNNKSIVSHRYGSLSQPIEISQDVDSLVLSVPEPSTQSP